MTKKKKSKPRKKSNSNNMFSNDFGSMSGMGDIGSMSGMGDPFKTKGKKSKDNDMMGMGGMMDTGFPTTENNAMGGGNQGATNNFGMGDFSQVGFEGDPPDLNGYDGTHIHPPTNDSIDMGMGMGGENMADVFGSKKRKPMATEAKQYSHRGKKMVEDPENQGNMIPLSTYKKRYGNTTQPTRQRRNQSGRNSGVGFGSDMGGDMGQAFGEMKATYNLGKTVAKTVRKKLHNPEVDMMGVEQQPDAQHMRYEKEGTVKYVVIINFEDGSSTSFTSNRLSEAKTAQKRYDADPSVTSTQLDFA